MCTSYLYEKGWLPSSDYLYTIWFQREAVIAHIEQILQAYVTIYNTLDDEEGN